MNPLKGDPRPPDLARMTLALLAGAAQAASLTWPLAIQTPVFRLLHLQYGQPVWWLQLLSLGLLAGLLSESRNWRSGALLGWLFGTTWLAGTVGWLFVAMHTYGGLPFVLAALAVFALTALLAVFYAVASALFVALAPLGRAWSCLVFAALWLLAELARGTWLTGFGWGAGGYAQVDGPLSSMAPWMGVYGLSAISAWLAMNLVHLLDWHGKPYARQRAGTLALMVLVLTGPAVYHRSAPELSQSAGQLSVTLLQGNIPQDEKFETGSGVPLALQWYAEQLKLSHSSLVIAPETAVPVLPQQLPPDYWPALQRHFDDGQQAALIGTPLGNYEQGYTNSVVGLKASQARTWRYDKHHLVPFGEFIPPFFRWFTAMMNIPLGDFNRGPPRQAPFEWQGQKLAANICYEDLFGEELASQFISVATAPTIFVNISNLGWFGRGLAIDQHLQISRMRALEFERPFVLATNTGATAFIDHRGQVRSELWRDRRAVLEGVVEGRTGITPYAWWVCRFGLWPLWLLGLGLLAARQRHRSPVKSALHTPRHLFQPRESHVETP